MRISGDDVLNALKGLRQPSSPSEIAKYLKNNGRTKKSIKSLITEVTTACKAGTTHGFIEACNGLYYSVNITAQLLRALDEKEPPEIFYFKSVNKTGSSQSNMCSTNHGRHIMEAKKKFAIGGGRFERPRANKKYNVINRTSVEDRKKIIEPPIREVPNSNFNKSVKAKRRIRNKAVKKRKPKNIRKNCKVGAKQIVKKKKKQKEILNKSTCIVSMCNACKELGKYDSIVTELLANGDYHSDYLASNGTIDELLSPLSINCKQLKKYQGFNELFAYRDQAQDECFSTTTQKKLPENVCIICGMKVMELLCKPVKRNKAIQCQLTNSIKPVMSDMIENCDTICNENKWTKMQQIANSYKERENPHCKKYTKKRRAYKKLPEKQMKCNGCSLKKRTKPKQHYQ